MKIEINCYEIEKYIVRYYLSGFIGEFEISFDTEEEALDFIKKERTTQWSNYKLLKISHAIF